MNNKSQNKLPQILTGHGEKKELMRIFNVCHVTVREALRGNISTPVALKIRKAAIERGGAELKK